MRRGGPNPNTGTTHTPTLPPFNRTTTQTEGGRQHTDGGHRTQDGEASNTAALHSPCHPPAAMPPHHPRWPHPPPRRGGVWTEDTPPHEEHGETVTHTTAPDPIGNSARHDSSTRQHCSGMSRARATRRTGQDSSSTHHRHSTHRGGWTPSTHPLIYSHSFVFTQQMINVDQRTTINVQ